MAIDERVVVDTNVLVVGNGKNPDADLECQLACIDALVAVRDDAALVLDEGGEILTEYAANCDARGRPGVGDEFFRWALDHRYTACTLVSLTPHDERVYVEFPDVAALRTFDRSDRKFVATALACVPVASILNAADSDWAAAASELSKLLKVDELCPILAAKPRRGRRRSRGGGR